MYSLLLDEKIQKYQTFNWKTILIILHLLQAVYPMVGGIG